MPYKPNMGPIGMPRYQAPTAQLAPQQPGIGEQLATSAAKKLAAEQVGKLGLQAAGTAAAGPLGGAVAGAAGDLVAPLAGKLVGGLFNKGGPVYLNEGGSWWQAASDLANQGHWDNDKRRAFANKHNLNYDQLTEAYDNEMDWSQVGQKQVDPEYLSFQQIEGSPEAQKILAEQGPNAYVEYVRSQMNKKPSKDNKEVVEEVVQPVAKPAPVDRAVGGSRGMSGTWNIPLGKIGDWSFGTSGHYAGDVKMNDGTKQKGNWGAMLKASTPFSFGAGDKIAESARMFDESVAKDIAEENKGSSAYWKSLGYSDDEAMDKIMEHLGMSDGGKVNQKKSIWGTIKDKVAGDFSKRKALMGGGKKPTYKAMGGLTPGPLGLSDMQELGKGQDVSKVVYKKKGGDIEDTMELNYHTPLKYQKPTNTGE